VAANYIAKWNGSSWSPWEAEAAGWGRVSALAVHDDGGGPALYAAGGFETAGDAVANGIARWNGSSWSPLGSGVGYVYALATFDDGRGPALYAGGGFQIAGGVTVYGIVKWDGSSWSPLGTGIGGSVFALVVYDDGGGPALYAGGSFQTAGGAPASNIARWDGSSWAPLGSGVGGGTYPPSSPWRCTTTAAARRSMSVAASRPRAECRRATSRGGMDRAGRRSAAV
jgi:hypothetical protein